MTGAGRSKRSRAPGIDTDVGYPTENLPDEQRPFVRAPSSGTVVEVGRSSGLITIRDKNGYLHKVLHMKLGISRNDERRAYKKKVSLGDEIGLLSNSATKKDHVHYFVVSPWGVKIDPANTIRDSEGNIIGIDDFDRYFEDLEIEKFVEILNQIEATTPVYDDMNAPETWNTA